MTRKLVSGIWYLVSGIWDKLIGPSHPTSKPDDMDVQTVISAYPDPCSKLCKTQTRIEIHLQITREQAALRTRSHNRSALSFDGAVGAC